MKDKSFYKNAWKNKIIFGFIFLIPLVAIAQKNNAAKIQVKKFPCCDSLKVGFMHIKNDDTLTCQQLSDLHAIIAPFKGCNFDAKSEIISYKIITDDGNTQSVKGHYFNGRAFLSQKTPAYFIITNCHVKCTNGMNESEKVILPDRKFIVVP